MTTYDILINSNLTYSPVNRWRSNRQPPWGDHIITRSLKKCQLLTSLKNPPFCLVSF